MNYTNITNAYYGGQEAYYYYPQTKKLIQIINIITSASVSEQLQISKIINILVNGNVFSNKNLSATIDILASALTSNLNLNISDQWAISNDGESVPGDGPSIYDGDPIDYPEPNYELGEDTIPEPK